MWISIFGLTFCRMFDWIAFKYMWSERRIRHITNLLNLMLFFTPASLCDIFRNVYLCWQMCESISVVCLCICKNAIRSIEHFNGVGVSTLLWIHDTRSLIHFRHFISDFTDVYYAKIFTLAVAMCLLECFCLQLQYTMTTTFAFGFCIQINFDSVHLRSNAILLSKYLFYYS